MRLPGLVLLAVSVGAQTHSVEFDKLAKQAETARVANRLDEAETNYKKAVRTKPSWAEGWWYLGTIYYEQDRYGEGRDAFRKAAALNAKNPAIWGMLGLCEFKTKEYDPALSHLQRARIQGLDLFDSQGVVVRYHLGMLLTLSGRFEEALEAMLLGAKALDPTPALITATGIAGMRMPILPADLPGEEREVVTLAGRALFETFAEHAHEAEPLYEEMAAKYPKHPNVHLLRGNFLLLGNPERGVADLKEELEIQPRSVPALSSLAYEFLTRKEADKALPYAKRAVEASGGDFVTHNAYGRALVESGDVEAGVKELELSRKLAPDSPQTHIALASAYAKLGRKEDAAHERAEFLRLKAIVEKGGGPK